MMKVADLVEEFCECNADKYYIYENYSGRGMFGRRCVGIVVRNGSFYMKMLMKLTKYFEAKGFDDVNFELEGMAVDELGLETIVYFPNMEE